MSTVMLSRGQTVNLSALVSGGYVTPSDAVRRRAAYSLYDMLGRNDLRALSVFFRNALR